MTQNKVSDTIMYVTLNTINGVLVRVVPRRLLWQWAFKDMTKEKRMMALS